MAWDDRGATEPGTNRDRFLSEFALALVEGVSLKEFLDWSVALLAEQSAIALRNARLVEELQRSNRVKDDFVANLSHEIRTPVR